MRTPISRLFTGALLSIALLAPLTITPTLLHAADRVYRDREHNDEHHWDKHEDQAYRIWARENHRKYRDFSKLREEDQRAYWAWRHEHSDAVLKINIR